MPPADAPSYASTVILVRPDAGGSFEILLTLRPPQMKFLGGFYVFPGGKVRTEDSSEAILKYCRGLSASDAQQKLGGQLDPKLSLGHWVAGIRELFEEVGILLCRGESGASVDLRNQKTKERLENKRAALVEGVMDFVTFMESERLACDLSRLVYFYHRVTPELFPIRFDTRFYLAALPLEQNPLVSSEEVVESLWIRPAEALERSRTGGFPLIPPTLTVLQTLAGVRSWEELRARYRL